MSTAQSASGYRVLVCGSREWVDGEAIYDRLCELPEGTTIVHGTARGADRWADIAAHRIYGLKPEPHPAAWDKLGKRAGFLRNVEMLESGIDRVIAFQVAGSRGTQHTIDEARRRHIPVEVHGA